MIKKKKDTSTMLIRDVPLEVWERINRICKQRRIKRREFLEQALAFFENRGKQLEIEAAKTEEARQGVDHILEKLKIFEDLMKIEPKIKTIRENVGAFGDMRIALKSFLELYKLETRFRELLKEVVPEPRMPDDVEVFRNWLIEAGAKHDFYDVPMDPNHPGQTDPDYKPMTVDDSVKLFKELFERKVEAEKETSISDSVEIRAASSEEYKAMQAKMPVRRLVPSAGKPQNDNSSSEKRKEIKTTIFGRGFPGVDEE
jgi:hypothetical protein